MLEVNETYNVYCDNEDCCARPGTYVCFTEAEAIAAWNSRAAMEFDNWFYLPKPKEGIVDYGEPEITRTENGYKVWNTADVVDEAARRWGDELGDYVMRRICEVFKPERTCHRVLDSELASKPGWHIKHRCSECGEKLNDVNYCPNCGAKVVG